MSTALAVWIVRAAALWLAVGLVVGPPFALRGSARADPSARGASLGLRLLLIPGSVLLWPVALVRWRAGRPPTERNAHRAAAQQRDTEGSAP